jgi:hypothetical protein
MNLKKALIASAVGLYAPCLASAELRFLTDVTVFVNDQPDVHYSMVSNSDLAGHSSVALQPYFVLTPRDSDDACFETEMSVYEYLDGPLIAQWILRAYAAQYFMVIDLPRASATSLRFEVKGKRVSNDALPSDMCGT